MLMTKWPAAYAQKLREATQQVTVTLPKPSHDVCMGINYGLYTWDQSDVLNTLLSTLTRTTTLSK